MTLTPLTALSMLLFATCLGGCAAARAPVDFAPLAADITILGEVHDNAGHHRNQAAGIAALAPKAVVFEMLTPEQAAAIRETDPRDSASLARQLDWANSGWPDFALYAPVFAAAPKGGIRGAALPRDTVRRAMTEGAAAPFGPEAGLYGLTRPLPAATQRAMEAEIADSHCGMLPAAVVPGMVEAQRLRDAAFARATLDAWRETGGPVVLITGTGHARADRAVPAYLRAAAPDLRVKTLGQIEAPRRTPTGQPDPSAGAPDPSATLKDDEKTETFADAPFDLLIVTPAASRPDPCESFQ